MPAVALPPATEPSPAPPGRVLAAVPCFNEGLTIGSLVLKAREHADEVLVIDDGSGDDTGEIARLSGATVLVHERQQGKAAGVLDAMGYAREHGYAALVLFDGDGQHNPDEIPGVAAPVLEAGADLVIGSRFLGTVAEIPLYRRFGQKVLNLFTNATADFKSTDSQSGFRALSRRALLATERFVSEGYNVESDMITYLSARGLAIAEVPISVRYEVPHKHKKNPVTHGMGVLANVAALIGARSPLIFFGIPGLALLLAGAAVDAYAISTFSASHQVPVLVAVVGGLVTVAGLLLVGAALVLKSVSMLLRHRR
ncbi:MAG: glycosyltransferase family 2 protein [Methanospirillum sp.]|nr:glycosyltransferase family 2 protein [Methanospirillum sp.]